MRNIFMLLVIFLQFISLGTNRVCCEELPDIRTIESDLIVPKMANNDPKAGARVKQVLPGYEKTELYHSLYLPTNYAEQSKKRLPVLIELSGNGGFRNRYGDESIGRPEGSSLGYGSSGGKDYIWVVLPFVNAAGSDVATKWWGDAPQYDPQPTIDYCTKAVPWICEQYGGDPDQVILIGFSRGAIACNYIGLYDDKIAKLWRGFVVYSHYDGVERWSYPKSDRDSAKERLGRLENRPQFICHEGTYIPKTKEYLRSTGIEGNFTLTPTGFRNHNDQWTLRPSAARNQLRSWLNSIAIDDDKR
ncbi:MAG: hypothetical protein ACI9G1_000010 [Pirellulaceae bacterium]|jgi:hypothetical protein